jgi:hypothetical protein
MMTRAPAIAGVRLAFLRAPGPERRARLFAEFPKLVEVSASELDADAARIDESEWRSAAAFDRFDRLWASTAEHAGWILLRGQASLADMALEMLNRYQRYWPRSNAASDVPIFEKVLERHASLHDLSKPLVRADFDHALDVWQWTLRLAPEASLELQLAALFHDIERLVSEPDRRIEHHAPDYQAFKDAHARSGAKLAARVLRECGVADASCHRVADLIDLHERPEHTGREAEAALLADADALSFFALNSPGFLDYYGPAHALRKVEYSLQRMTPRSRARVRALRLRADVRVLLEAARPSGAGALSPMEGAP